MRRGTRRARRGPGLLGTAARTAVIAGTATSVSGRVAARQAGAAAPPPVAAPVTEDLVDQITRLGGLVQAGLLTEEEFAAQKAKLLGT
jgi:Short C-terminal domain